MQVHGPNTPLHSVLSTSSASQSIDICPVCQGLENASVSGPYQDSPFDGQVHTILESLFLPVATWLKGERQLTSHVNASVDRFIRDKSCKDRPAIITATFPGQIFEFCLGGTVEGDKGLGYPAMMDFFTIPIDPDPDAPAVNHPTNLESYHVHSSPKWPSKPQAYVVTTKMRSKPILHEAEGHIQSKKWTERREGHLDGPGNVFRFSDSQLDRLQDIWIAQLRAWSDLPSDDRLDMIATFQRCLDNKSTASTERRENGSQRRERKSDMDYADASECTVEPDSKVWGRRIDAAVLRVETESPSVGSSGKKKRGVKSTIAVAGGVIPSLRHSYRSSRSSRPPAAGLGPIPEIVLQDQRPGHDNPRHSFVSTSESEVDSDGPRTPEQTSATLSTPHVVGRDDSSAHCGLYEEAHTSTSSSPVGIPVSSASNRRTKLPEVPLRSGESHKESRKSKQRKLKRASIESGRTVKADYVPGAVSFVSLGAPEASEHPKGSGGLLRRVASMRGLRFK